MTLSEPTLAPPMAPSTVDMAQIFVAHAERAARIEALLHPDTRAVRGFRTARKRFYRQMLCAHAARLAAGDTPVG